MKRLGAHGLCRPMAVLIGTAVLLLACGPATTPPAGEQRDVAASRTGPEKILRIANQTEPDWLVRFGRVTGQTFTAGRYFIWYGSLTYHNYDDQPVAHAAVKVPSVSDGDWVINP